MARLALGLDTSTQGLKGVVIDIDTGEIVFERNIYYKTDERTRKYVTGKEPFYTSDLGLTEQTPQMFMASLDAFF